MTQINHWGKWIDSDNPTTGVLSSNDIAFEWLYDDCTCLTCEEIIKEINNTCICHCKTCMKNLCDECENCKDFKQNELEYIECDSSHTRIHGDWLQDDKGLYYPDPNGEFAFIENESTIQVVYSIYITHKCKPCSPCYPGQLDVDYDYDDTEWQAYTLPDELLRLD